MLAQAKLCLVYAPIYGKVNPRGILFLVKFGAWKVTAFYTFKKLQERVEHARHLHFDLGQEEIFAVVFSDVFSAASHGACCHLLIGL